MSDCFISCLEYGFVTCELKIQRHFLLRPLERKKLNSVAFLTPHVFTNVTIMLGLVLFPTISVNVVNKLSFFFFVSQKRKKKKVFLDDRLEKANIRCKFLGSQTKSKQSW